MYSATPNSIAQPAVTTHDQDPNDDPEYQQYLHSSGQLDAESQALVADWVVEADTAVLAEDQPDVEHKMSNHDLFILQSSPKERPDNDAIHSVKDLIATREEEWEVDDAYSNHRPDDHIIRDLLISFSYRPITVADLDFIEGAYDMTASAEMYHQAVLNDLKAENNAADEANSNVIDNELPDNDAHKAERRAVSNKRGWNKRNKALDAPQNHDSRVQFGGRSRKHAHRHVVDDAPQTPGLDAKLNHNSPDYDRDLAALHGLHKLLRVNRPVRDAEPAFSRKTGRDREIVSPNRQRMYELEKKIRRAAAAGKASVDDQAANVQRPHLHQNGTLAPSQVSNESAHTPAPNHKPHVPERDQLTVPLSDQQRSAVKQQPSSIVFPGIATLAPRDI